MAATIRRAVQAIGCYLSGGLWLRRWLLAASLASCWPGTGWAQRQYDAWYFGRNVGLQFLPGHYWPQQLTASAMDSFEACTSLADSTTGNVLFYSNGERIWDRTHQVMPASYPLGGHSSASEGALALFAPGQPSRAYVFTTDAKENNLRNSLRYSVVDLRLRGGLGDVVQRSVPVALPGGALATEHLAAVRQPNGRDYWIIVHGSKDNAFYAYALTPSGLATQPVVSLAGAVFDGTDASQTGTLRFSPSGQQLAMTQLITARLDLFDFAPLTGRVGAATTLFYKPDARFITSVYRVFGCEFSPDGSILYGDENGAVVRYDLLAGNADAIRASKRLLTTAAAPLGLTGSFRRGPNNRLYIASLGATALATVDSCNSLQAAYLRPNGQPLSGPALPYGQVAATQYCLPNAPGRSWVASGSTGTGQPGSAPPAIEEGFTTEVTPGCAGQPTRLAVRLRDPMRRGIAQVQWSIGTGPAPLVLTGPTVAPTFGQPGQQLVYVVVTFGDGSRQAQRLALTVPPLATVRLLASAQQLACGEPAAELTANANSAGRFSWDDDTTTLARRRVSRPGTYRVHFLSAAGCLATDSVTITQLAGSECFIPNIITPNGDAANQHFVLSGYAPGHWSLTLFNRWGRQVYFNAQYANEWDAAGQPAGLYYYQLVHPATGTRLRGWVEVVH